MQSNTGPSVSQYGGFNVRVTIHRVLTGAAAELGAVRFDIDNAGCILLAANLSVEAEADLLGELLRADDTVDYTVPAQATDALAG